MAQDLKSIYDYDKIEPVIIDGQYMVKIPKFYIKVGYPGETSQNAGKRTIWITSKPRDGFHIHPAFVKDNKVMDCFYYGAYEASNADDPEGNTYDSTGYSKIITGPKAASLNGVHAWNRIYKEEAQTACNARNVENGTEEQTGWHLHNVYEITAISMLMILEYGRTDFTTLIGKGNIDKGRDITTSFGEMGADTTVLTGTTDAIWRGIHELWGNCLEHADGMYCDKNNDLYVFHHKMDGTYVKTSFNGNSIGGNANSVYGKVIGYWGYPTKLIDGSGDGYDFADFLLPAAMDAISANGSFDERFVFNEANGHGDAETTIGNQYRYRPQTNLSVHGASSSIDINIGPLNYNVSNGNSRESNGFRIAKYGTTTDEVAFDE